MCSSGRSPALELGLRELSSPTFVFCVGIDRGSLRRPPAPCLRLRLRLRSSICGPIFEFVLADLLS